MKKIIFCLILVFLSGLFFLMDVQATDVRKQEVQRQMENLSSSLQPSAKQKVLQAVRMAEDKVFQSGGNVDCYAASVSSIKSQFTGLSAPDIDALVSLVMFELWKSEQDALKEIMDEMRRMNQAKDRQRDYIDSLKRQQALLKDKARGSYDKFAATHAQNKCATPKILPEMASTRRLNIKFIKTPKLPAFRDLRQMSATELADEIRCAEERMNSIADMSQMDQLALQDAMQKEQQFIQTISNIMKNQHDTLKSIINNLK